MLSNLEELSLGPSSHFKPRFSSAHLSCTAVVGDAGSRRVPELELVCLKEDKL